MLGHFRAQNCNEIIDERSEQENTQYERSQAVNFFPMELHSSKFELKKQKQNKKIQTGSNLLMRKVLKLFCSMDVPLKRDIAAQSLADTVLLVKHQKLRGGLCRHKEQNVTNRTTTTPCARIAPMERVIRKDGHFVNIICVCPFLGWDGQCEFCGWKFGGPSAKQF